MEKSEKVHLYVRGLKEKWRFKLSNGSLSIEDLYDCDEEDLDKIYLEYKKLESEMSPTNSLIQRKTSKAKDIELRLELIKDIYERKVEERLEKQNRQKLLEKKRKVEAQLATLEESSLEGKTKEELLAELDKVKEDLN